MPYVVYLVRIIVCLGLGEASSLTKTTENIELDSRHKPNLNVEVDREIDKQRDKHEECIKESKEMLSRVQKKKYRRITFEEANFTSDLEKYIEKVVETLESSKSAMTELRPTKEEYCDQEKHLAVAGAGPSTVTNSNHYVPNPVAS